MVLLESLKTAIQLWKFLNILPITCGHIVHEACSCYSTSSSKIVFIYMYIESMKLKVNGLSNAIYVIDLTRFLDKI